jgi:hypothetical protein
VNSRATIAYEQPSKWHLIIARHGDGTVTTLCTYEHCAEVPGAEGKALCQFCADMLRELNATAVEQVQA